MVKKIGRNAPCPCGSGKKYKKCHASFEAADAEYERTTYGAFGRNPDRQAIGKRPIKNLRTLIARIESERRSGTRPLPSAKLVSIGDAPPLEDRKFLVDLCARLVDQNFGGRSEMCVYFAVLLRHGMNVLGYPSDVEVGRGEYRYSDSKTFGWDHAWVRTGAGDIIDGNIDSVVENPMVPVGVEPVPYWGPANQLLADRLLTKDHVLPPERDLIELDAEPTRQWKRTIETEIARRRNAI